MSTRRSISAAVAALLLAPTLAACSFSAGELEPIGGESEAAETTTSQEAGADLQTVTAGHITAQIPADWQLIGADSGWPTVYQIPDDKGGVAARIGLMPVVNGGSSMTPQEAIDWYITQAESGTNGDYAVITTLRTGADRTNTTYTYTSAGLEYKGVVWALVDSNGVSSLVQLSGAKEIITPDLIAQVDESLDLTGDATP